MGGSWGRTTQPLCCLATLIALGAPVAGGQERAASEFEAFTGQIQASANPDRAAPVTPSTDFEARIETLIRSWFSAIEDLGADVTISDGLPSGAPFELRIDGGELRNRDALVAWMSNLRASRERDPRMGARDAASEFEEFTSYPQIEYRLGPIRILAEERDRYRVRFEFDRHAVDAAGLLHVARREHTWIVQRSASAAPVILSIEERPLLFFPGTGPQIVCY
jgi:hypothetical protein